MVKTWTLKEFKNKVEQKDPDALFLNQLLHDETLVRENFSSNEPGVVKCQVKLTQAGVDKCNAYRERRNTTIKRG